MAKLIPARSACLSRMTSGERRFAQRLEDKLEDDYLVWYDVPVGIKQRQPDFVVLHPRRGLLVLEVKDWKLDTLHDLNKYVAELRTERGLVKEENPLIADAHDEGCAWDRIAVIWRHRNHAEVVSRALVRKGIPHVWSKDSYSKEHLFDGEHPSSSCRCIRAKAWNSSASSFRQSTRCPKRMPTPPRKRSCSMSR